MAIAFVQSKSAGSGTTPPAVTLTSVATSGNLLVAEIMSHNTNTNHTIAGWTALTNISTGSGGTTRSGRLFYKISDGTEQTITGGAQSNWSMAVAEYSGIDTNVPLVVENSNSTASSTTHTTPTVNAESTPDMLVFLGGMARNNTALSNEQVNSSTTGVTEREEVLGGTVCKLVLADKIVTTASGNYNAQFDCATASVGIAGIALFRGSDGTTLMDSYADTNQDTNYSVSAGGVNFQGVAQSFTGNGGTVDSAVFQLRKASAPTGNASFKLFAHSGTFGTSSIPTGTVLATSGTIDVSTLPTAYRLVKLTFASPYTTVNTTKYTMVVEFTGGDTTNSLQVGRDASSPTHGGNAADSTDLSAWNAQSGRDLIFYISTAGAGGTTLSINKSESITVTESKEALLTALVSKTENITVTESVGVNLVSLVNIPDSITITEATATTLVHTVNVTDSTTLTESIKLLNTELVTVSDSITLTESLNLDGVPNPSVSDSVTVSESVNLVLTSFVTVSDTATITENVNLAFSNPINISDTVTLTESVKLLLEAIVNTSDTTTLTENTQPNLVSFTSVADNISLTEAVGLVQSFDITVSDSVSVSEVVSLQLSLSVNVTESITVTESTKTELNSFVNVSDTSTLTENLVTTLIALISVSDSISVSESSTVYFGFNVSVNESIGVSESVSIAVINAGDRSVTVAESITLTESVTNLLTIATNLNDSITVTEQILRDLVVNTPVSDTITLSEASQGLVGIGITVSELTTLSESLALFLNPLLISLTDNITVTEYVEALAVTNATLLVTASETIQISESVDLDKDEGAPWTPGVWLEFWGNGF